MLFKNLVCWYSVFRFANGLGEVKQCAMLVVISDSCKVFATEC